jgi:hypothetical protein
VKLPKSFELYGRTITVVYSDLQDAACAIWQSDLDRITVDPDLPKDTKAQSFLHECCHAWLEALGREDLSQDERFVDSLSGLMHQMLKTGR